jgi:hypothetical protein
MAMTKPRLEAGQLAGSCFEPLGSTAALAA